MSETYKVAGLELESPLMNAAGAINHFNPETILNEARLLANTGVGAIQPGSVTKPPSPGNEVLFGEPTHHYDPRTGKMANSKGLPSPGKDEMLRITPELVAIAHEAGKAVIMSVSATKDAGSSVEQSVELAESFLETEVDRVIVNVSCPNIVEGGDGRKPIMGYDFDTMEELVETFWERIGETGRLGVKPANHVTIEQKLLIPRLAGLYRGRPVFTFMEGPNTIPGYVPVDDDGNNILSVPGGAGGLSGPATRANGREQLELWADEVSDFMDIISAQGVDSGKEMAWRLGHGAVAASGVSFLWNSRKWEYAVTQMLEEYAAEVAL